MNDVLQAASLQYTGWQPALRLFGAHFPASSSDVQSEHIRIHNLGNETNVYANLRERRTPKFLIESVIHSFHIVSFTRLIELNLE